jgi:hypothetical protein
MPRPSTTGTGTALVVTDTAWQSIEGHTVPKRALSVKSQKGDELETELTGNEDFCLRHPGHCFTLQSTMPSASANGKYHAAISAPIVAPFAVPRTR